MEHLLSHAFETRRNLSFQATDPHDNFHNRISCCGKQCSFFLPIRSIENTWWLITGEQNYKFHWINQRYAFLSIIFANNLILNCHASMRFVRRLSFIRLPSVNTSNIFVPGSRNRAVLEHVGSRNRIGTISIPWLIFRIFISKGKK